METFLAWMVIIGVFSLPGLIYLAIKAREARKETEFQQKHPELWREQQLLKLQRERMEAEKQLAEKRAHQEATTRNVGLIFGIGRGLGWW